MLKLGDNIKIIIYRWRFDEKWENGNIYRVEDIPGR